MHRAASALTAADMMTTKVVTLRPELRAFEAVEMLLKHKISGAPVVDADGNLVGVFSEKDGLKAMMRALHDNLPSSVVADDMSTDLLTVVEEAQLLTVVHHFVTHSVRRLPVVSGTRLVGLISRRDVLRSAKEVMDTPAPKGMVPLYLSAVSDGDEVPIDT